VSYEGDLLAGLAALLVAAGAGTYSASGTVTPDATGTAIVLGPLPSGTGRVVALADYPVDDDPMQTDVIVGVQILIRADETPAALRTMRETVHNALHGRRGSVAGLPVSVIWRNSGTALGPDERGLLTSSDNYYVQGNRASTHRNDE
jgi:hypothetical protein